MTICSIPLCDFKAVSLSLGRKLHLFQVPKDLKKRAEWQKNIPNHVGLILSVKNRICELHFEENFVLKSFVHIINGKEVRFPRDRYALTEDAIPTLFRTVELEPKALGNITNIRNLETLTANKLSPRKIDVFNADKTDPAVSSPCCKIGIENKTVSSARSCRVKTQSESSSTTKIIVENHPRKIFLIPDNIEDRNQAISSSHRKIGSHDDKLATKEKTTKNLAPDKTNTEVGAEKLHQPAHDDEPKSLVENPAITSPLENPLSTTSVQNLQRTYNRTPVSQRVLIKRAASISVSQLEFECNTYLNEHSTPKTPKRLSSASAKELYYNRHCLKTKTIRIVKLKKKISELSKEIDTLRSDAERINFLAKRQQLIIKECLNNSTAKSANGYRYSKEWLLDSLLLKIKSRSTYTFLRDNKYLPLPSIGTLNTSIQNLKATFGFDETLFESLRIKLVGLPEKERRGVLM